MSKTKDTKPTKSRSAASKTKSTDFTKDIMSSIKDDNVKMHSKWYFVALSAISVTSIFLTSLLAAIFINLTVRDIDYAEDLGLRGFGDSGRDEFLSSFPWALVLLALVAITSTVMLARKLEFAYKYRGHLYFGAALGLIAAFGVGMSVLGLNSRFEEAQPLRALQTLKERVDERVLVGEVVGVEDEYIELETIEGDVIKVEVDDKIRYPQADFEVEVGDEIGVLGGKLEDGIWQAEVVGPKPPRGPRVKGLKNDKLRRYLQDSGSPTIEITPENIEILEN